MLTIVYYMAFCKWKILHNERLIFDAVRKEGGGNGEDFLGFSRFPVVGLTGKQTRAEGAGAQRRREIIPQRHSAAERQPNGKCPQRRGGAEGIFWTGCTGLTGWEGARGPIGWGEFIAGRGGGVKVRGARKLLRFAVRTRGGRPGGDFLDGMYRIDRTGGSASSDWMGGV